MSDPVIDLKEITLLSELVSSDANFAKKAWENKVKIDARNKNEFAPLIGYEGSGKPICEKQDLKKFAGDTVTFTRTAPVRGRGRMGEESLKDNTNTFKFGTFQVKVGMRRFAIAWNQLLSLLRLRGDDMSAEQLEQELSADWWGSMEMDDIQHVLLRTAFFESSGRNVIRAGNRAARSDLTLDDTLTTGLIELAQSKLLSLGGTPIHVEKDTSGGEIPRYVFFTPWESANSLEEEQIWRDVLQNAGARGGQNDYFTGRMPLWKQMLVHRHNIIEDTADGRIGSPLQPLALLGAAIANNSATTITGGGSYNDDGAKTNVALNDYFAHFPGFAWTTYEGEVAPTDTNTYYAIIYNLTDHKYEGISYAASGNDGNRLTSVTREVASIIGTGHARFSAVHPSESLIIPCTENGVPIGFSLGLASDALYLAKGSIDAERITHGDDFRNSEGRWHHNAAGVQGIRGYVSPQDTKGRYPNFLVAEHAREIPGVSLVDNS